MGDEKIYYLFVSKKFITVRMTNPLAVCNTLSIPARTLYPIGASLEGRGRVVNAAYSPSFALTISLTAAGFALPPVAFIT